MQKPFPELTRLAVTVNIYQGVVSGLPDSFLGRSAPRLQELRLGNIPFPSVPKLLSSANGLVTLSLMDIPDSGYISPDALATALSVMTRLEFLNLQFCFPQSLPDPASRPLPPPTPFVLPTLTRLMFRGAYEYSEDLLTRINAPLLYYLSVIFFFDLDLDVPQVHRFIGHAEEFKACNYANVLFFTASIIEMGLYSDTRAADGHDISLVFHINGENGEDTASLLSALAQACNSPLVSVLEELAVMHDLPLNRTDDRENIQWVEFLHLFTAVKHHDLCPTDELTGDVCDAL